MNSAISAYVLSGFQFFLNLKTDLSTLVSSVYNLTLHYDHPWSTAKSEGRDRLPTFSDAKLTVKHTSWPCHYRAQLALDKLL